MRRLFTAAAGESVAVGAGTWSARFESALLSSSSRTTSRWPLMEAVKRPVRPACTIGCEALLAGRGEHMVMDEAG